MSKETKAAEKELKGIAEVKDCGKSKARFVIVDGKEMVFMLMDDADEDLDVPAAQDDEDDEKEIAGAVH